MRDYTEYLKIPFLHRGRGWEGADCFGILRLYYEKELGITLPDFTEEYCEDWWGEKNYFLDLYASYGFRQVDNPAPHDLVMFRNSPTAVGHVGIVVDSSNFLHMTKAGGGVGNYLFSAWQRQVHSFYRHESQGT